MDRCQMRIWFMYLLTFVILVFFFYHLLANNKKSISALARLKEDVECLSATLNLQSQKCGGKSCDAAKLGYNSPGICGDSDGAPTGSSCGSRDLNSYIDSVLKRKLGIVMDDIYNIKKQLIGSNCKGQAQASLKNEAVSVMPKTRINYADDALGARINDVKATPIGSTNVIKNIIGLDFSGNPPINMLRSSMEPGSCFGFCGGKATVTITLARTIIVEEIAISHIPKEMTPKMCVDNAPKDFEVQGINPENNKKECLGNFVYENSCRKRTQKFNINNKGSYRNLIFIFNTNHGAKSTCIYRLEVYGRAA